MCHKDNDLPIWKRKKYEAMLHKPKYVPVSVLQDYVSDIKLTRGVLFSKIEKLQCSVKKDNSPEEISNTVSALVDSLFEGLLRLGDDIRNLEKALRFEKH